MTDPQQNTLNLQELAERAGRELEDAPALEILRWAADTFGPRFCVAPAAIDELPQPRRSHGRLERT